MKLILQVLLLFITYSVFSQEKDRLSQEIDSLVMSKYNDGLFNGSILVQKDSRIIYKKSLGWANIENKDTLKLSDPMRIASTSKTFTAMAVLKLVDEGKINLQEDINTYLPQIQKTGITIHHLLSHTSGIAYINGGNHFKKMKKYQKERKDVRFTNNDVLNYFKEYNPKSRFASGDKSFYSNIGYSILASLVEHVSGISFKQYLQLHFFTPLKMTNTLLYLPNSINNNPEKVSSYTKRKNKLVRSYAYYNYNKEDSLVSSNDIYGDKYILSTIEDLNKFNNALINGNIISDSLMKIAFSRVKLNNGKINKMNYGYGIMLDKWFDSTTYFHSGSLASFVSYNTFRKDGTQVIILSNVDNFSAGNILYSIYDCIDNTQKTHSLQLSNKQLKFLPIFNANYKINY